jgi:hypothetical protein
MRKSPTQTPKPRSKATSKATSRANGRRLLAVALVAGLALAAVAGTMLTSGRQADAAGSASLPAAGHVFVINLENKGYDQTWGPGSAAPYLSTTLRSRGVLLNQYFGTAHNSLPNYVAKVGDQYAARHNPFVYFAAITGSADCAQRDVDLSRLPADLASASSTPTLSYITPNLCHDGHDTPCVDGQPGGLASADSAPVA